MARFKAAQARHADAMSSYEAALLAGKFYEAAVFFQDAKEAYAEVIKVLEDARTALARRGK